MADVAAAKRYAQAAFGIARDSGTLATWRAELADVAAVLADSQLAPVLANASLPIETRLAMVERTLAVSPMVLNLAKLLVQKGRSLDAGAVASAFTRMANENEGIQISTIELNETINCNPKVAVAAVTLDRQTLSIPAHGRATLNATISPIDTFERTVKKSFSPSRTDPTVSSFSPAIRR